MGLTIKRAATEREKIEDFSAHMTAIQNLYDEVRRENRMKSLGCEVELKQTKQELQETKKKLQIAEKKYDDLMKEIRTVFSFVKGKDSSAEGLAAKADIPADYETEGAILTDDYEHDEDDDFSDMCEEDFEEDDNDEDDNDEDALVNYDYEDVEAEWV